jgi:hypothetical protein
MPVILRKDFAQILLVVSHSLQANIVQAYL